MTPEGYSHAAVLCSPVASCRLRCMQHSMRRKTCYLLDNNSHAHRIIFACDDGNENSTPARSSRLPCHAGACEARNSRALRQQFPGRRDGCGSRSFEFPDPHPIFDIRCGSNSQVKHTAVSTGMIKGAPGAGVAKAVGARHLREGCLHGQEAGGRYGPPAARLVPRPLAKLAKHRRLAVGLRAARHSSSLAAWNGPPNIGVRQGAGSIRGAGGLYHCPPNGSSQPRVAHC